MTSRFAVNKTDRRKRIRLLRELAKHLKDAGDDKANNALADEARKGFRYHDQAWAINWALGFVGQHMNLETGELTISLELAEETA